MAQAAKIKARKLYMVRIHDDGTFGRQVGHKSRLIPRKAAQRVARRLRQSRRFDMVEIYPMTVNLTPDQAAYLDCRYGAGVHGISQ
jgi:hypothetical protein